MHESDDFGGGRDYLELKRTLKALGDEVRLHIIAVLAGSREMNVTDLVQILAHSRPLISQPLVSWHLSVLRRAGLVRRRRTGRQVYCSLDRERYQLCLRALADLVAAPTTGASPSPAMPRPDASGARLQGV
jgi:DNA-binding transcriptional ArsR family regulator